MNWKLRLKNKATLTALIAAAITFVYSVLGTLGIAPAIGQDEVTSLVSALLTVLAALGIVTDPTTPGVSDSERAKAYTEPGSSNGLQVAMTAEEIQEIMQKDDAQ